MKSQFLKMLTLICLLGIGGTASAEFRAVWICSLADGKTLDDVRVANTKWVEFVNANVDGGGITSHILTPVFGDVTAGRFIYSDGFPTMAAWSAARASMQESDEGKAIDAELNEVAECSEHHLYDAEKS